MTIGVWTNNGTVIPQVGSDGPAQPNVLYEGGAIILSGTVFKMWFGTTGGVCYAESTDGLSWTRYSGNPIVGSASLFPRVFKNGSTYYLYTALAQTGNLSAYTSTDGVTWTLQNANALVRGSQAWETGSGTFWGQLSVVGVIAGVWYGYYTSYVSGTASYAMGLATSTDGITWTKSASNPVITADGPSNFFFQQIGGTYYGWSQIVLPGIPAFGSLGLPSDIMRYSATNPAGPWTPLGTTTYYRTNSVEGVGITTGQVADPTMVAANGNLYIYYAAKSAGQVAGGAVINCAIASGMTFAQLVQTREGLVNIPIPAAGLALNLNALATDNFSRANANPIGGNWTNINTSAGWTTAQILSDKATSSIAGDNADSYWNAISWGSDQWSQVTVAACAASSFVGTDVRMNTSGLRTMYRSYWNAGTIGGSAVTYFIAKDLSGVQTNILSIGPIHILVGDNLLLCVIGTQVSFYQNNNLLGAIADSNVTSGAPGFAIAPITAVTNAGLSAWTGGNVQNAPPIPAGGSGGSWLTVDFANSLRGLRH